MRIGWGEQYTSSWVFVSSLTSPSCFLSFSVTLSFRYANCARCDEEINLVAFQYRGEILYRCIRPINSGQELMVWYEAEYAKELSPAFHFVWNKKCSTNGKVRPYLLQIFLVLFNYICVAGGPLQFVRSYQALAVHQACRLMCNLTTALMKSLTPVSAWY